MSKVLVVDDDPALRRALERALRLEGHDVVSVGNGADGLQMIRDGGLDAVVLDLMLPRLGGLEVCRRLRAEGNPIPIIALTARDQVEDRVAGLDAGADDYLVKPFALDELHARVRALLRRNTPVAQPQGETLTCGDLVVDVDSHTVTRSGVPLELTRTEFSLLAFLVENKNRVVPRHRILDEVWGYDSDTMSNSLEVFVSYLRRKLEANGGDRLLHTVRGIGYQVREPK